VPRRNYSKLSVALRAMRHDFYAEDYWKRLGYKTMPKKWQLQALLLKLIEECSGDDTESDLLLMAFGLLKGYSKLDYNARNVKFLDENSDYFREQWPDHYKKTKSKIRSKRTRTTALKKACANLTYAVDGLNGPIDRLANAIKEKQDTGVWQNYIEEIDKYVKEIKIRGVPPESCTS